VQSEVVLTELNNLLNLITKRQLKILSVVLKDKKKLHKCSKVWGLYSFLYIC